MKVLLIGASSFLGKKIERALVSREIDFVGTYYAKPIQGNVHRKLDLLNSKEINEVLVDVNPDAVIMTAAVSTIEECEAKKTFALAVNTFSVSYVADWCFENKRLLIYISTECVFDGLSSPYHEWSYLSPINFYGKTKAMAEKLLETIDCPFAIVRLPLLYGYNDKFDKQTLFRTVIKNLSGQRSIVLDNKRVKYPILIDDVAEGLIVILKNRLRGIFNFTIASGYTKYEFGLKIAEIFDFDKSLIGGESIEELGTIKKPMEVQLTNNYMHYFSFMDIEEGLKLVKVQISQNSKGPREAYI